MEIVKSIYQADVFQISLLIKVLQLLYTFKMPGRGRAGRSTRASRSKKTEDAVSSKIFLFYGLGVICYER